MHNKIPHGDSSLPSSLWSIPHQHHSRLYMKFIFGNYLKNTLPQSVLCIMMIRCLCCVHRTSYYVIYSLTVFYSIWYIYFLLIAYIGTIFHGIHTRIPHTQRRSHINRDRFRWLICVNRAHSKAQTHAQRVRNEIKKKKKKNLTPEAGPEFNIHIEIKTKIETTRETGERKLSNINSNIYIYLMSWH